jgi:hypothetical protein
MMWGIPYQERLTNGARDLSERLVLNVHLAAFA